MMSNSIGLSPAADIQMPSPAEKLPDTENLRHMKSAKKDAMQMAKIDETAQEFEAVFISEMLQHMFAGIEVNEEFGGGHGEEMFRSLLVDEYGKLMAKAGGIGVADHIRQEILQLQEI